MVDLKAIIGSRVLLTIKGKYDNSDVQEYKILEASPSGNWIKLMNIHGNKFWKAVTSVAFVELLKEIKSFKDEVKDE